jgi:hypothetical protein
MDINQIRKVLKKPLGTYDIKNDTKLSIWDCGCVIFERYKDVDTTKRFKYKPCEEHSYLDSELE